MLCSQNSYQQIHPIIIQHPLHKSRWQYDKPWPSRNEQLLPIRAISWRLGSLNADGLKLRTIYSLCFPRLPGLAQCSDSHCMTEHMGRVLAGSPAVLSHRTVRVSIQFNSERVSAAAQVPDCCRHHRQRLPIQYCTTTSNQQ